MPSKNAVKEPKVSKVAVYSSGNIYHPVFGRLQKGYSILDPTSAKEWMELSNKVREATPEEVAVAYGV